MLVEEDNGLVGITESWLEDSQDWVVKSRVL